MTFPQTLSLVAESLWGSIFFRFKRILFRLLASQSFFRERGLGNEVGAQCIANQLVQEKDGAGVVGFDRSKEVEAADEEFSAADGNFEKIGAIREACGAVDAADKGRHFGRERVQEDWF